MPNRSDYEALPQTVDEDHDYEEGDALLPTLVQEQPRGIRRANRPGSIDIRKLDNAFKRWTESIAQRMKRKKKKTGPIHEKLEILRSVFDPPVTGRVAIKGLVKTLDHGPPMSKEQYDGTVNAIKSAILEGLHPKMITKGSSGSYFARAKLDGKVQTVAVFKPKDEEPYGRLNPKTTKWLHRKLSFIIPFGRACLIPNLSYISEAAASLLDRRLDLNIVPRTELVSLSSTAFFYDWIDRSNHKKGKPLPDKIGSMQVFMHGYTDASDFLRKHPWPGRSIADTFDDSTHRRRNFNKRMLGAIKVVCGKTGAEDETFEDDEEENRFTFDASETTDGDVPFYWSPVLQRSFRAELEKLVILDYLMRNTDRGADNYMIKYCDAEHEKSHVSTAPTRGKPMMSEIRTPSFTASPPDATPNPNPNLVPPPRPSRSNSTAADDYRKHPHIHIAAIDNSLSFPHEHPHGWRSYTYGWLYLPVSLIGRPFSQQTRDHFLPMLTSKEWWQDTTYQLRELFAVDPDFNERMWSKQLALIKGQAWNIVQSLRHDDEGPLELTRRTSAMVWDDKLEVADDSASLATSIAIEAVAGPLTGSIASLPPRPSHQRVRSSASEFPPPRMRRMSSTDTSGFQRPVPFSAKFQRVHPGTTGVTVLEHMERLDRVEAGLDRLAGGEDEVDEMDEEQDVGDLARPPKPILGLLSPPEAISGPSSAPTAPFLASSPSLAPVLEVSSSSSVHTHSDVASVPADVEEDEEDVAALSKSLSHLDNVSHGRWTMRQSGIEQRSGLGLEWMQDHESEESSRKKTVIVERLELIEKKAYFTCW
ncbi:hypothetical protein PENSPDRAFT_750288 [Peniophora sp. CONT]|nr:hypothetical protein PENSPDRAFT_750288 [Peniophora sp. CONT]